MDGLRKIGCLFQGNKELDATIFAPRAVGFLVIRVLNWAKARRFRRQDCREVNIPTMAVGMIYDPHHSAHRRE